MPFQKFLRYLQFEKRYSSHTITAYGNDLKQFFLFIEKTYQINSPKEITHFYVRSWMVSLMETKIDARSVNRKISTLKSFFKFLLRSKEIEHNPMQKIISPKVAKKLPSFIDSKKMDLLLDGEMFENTFEGIRDKLIINMFYQTGMRVSELVAIKETDIDLNNLSINVLGKRNKVRMIPITFEMKRHIQAYSEERKKQIATIHPDANYFVRNDGNKMSRMVVYNLVKEKLGNVTTGQKRSPHVLRHTFATQMLNNGAEINAVKEILGHASLAATQVYTHNTIEKLKNIYKQAHPKA